VAVGSGCRAVPRRRRPGVPATAGTAASSGDVRQVVYGHAGRSDQRLDAQWVTETGRGHEWIVLTWAVAPTKGPFSSRVASSSLRAVQAQLVAIYGSALITIIGTSFVGPAAARLALMLVSCAGLVLVTPASASHRLDASTELHVVDCPSTPDSARDREWRDDVNGSASDACDDDDDGDDESSAASGLVTSGRAHLDPDFSDSSRVSGATEDRRGSRGRDVHFLRGPPARPMESSNTDDDSASTHRSTSRCGVNRREPHLPLPCDPFHSASPQSDYGLRAPP